MSSVCIYFQIHQPVRLRKYTFFDLGVSHYYEDDALNREVLNKVSNRCYLQANAKLHELIARYKGKFKFAISISGSLIDQLEKYRPDVLQSFQRLVQTGHVELLSETYYHSLSYIYSKDEFVRQVKMHEKKIYEVFKKKPKVFRNTELIYYNELAQYVEGMGYKGILAEGIDWYLLGRSANVLYQAPNTEKIKTLLRNYRLTDDVAFRFSDASWAEYPLTPSSFATKIAKQLEDTDVVNLFMDYETIGEHHSVESGIFDFWNHLPDALFERGIEFKTPSEVVDSYTFKDVYDVHEPSSWADTERDLSAWRANSMQHEALEKIYKLEARIKKTKNKDLIDVWSRMQISDHFYYMSTKTYGDGQVHDYFRPYGTAYDAYIYFMNVLSDLEITLEK